jgi:arylsulfatase A-like enzyme
MPERPNVVVVLCDQLRAAATGCHGNDQVATPTLDRMAAAGTLFERAYTSNPVCSPARGTLLTGCHAHVHSVVGNKLRLPEQPTVATELRDAGYRTAYVGKWHLDGESAPGYIPPERRQGFDFWRGFNRGHEHLRGHPHPNPDGSVDWKEGYQPAVQTDLFCEFVAEHCDGDADRPFFGLLSWGPPHTPFEAPEEYAEMYDPEELDLRENVPESEDTPELREDLAEYYAMVTSLDDQMERLLDTLDEEGIAEETLVVFTSDHGEMLGSHGHQRKNYPHEESVHVPLIARQPGTVPVGERIDELVSFADLMPTVLSWCDVDVPERVQGEDVAPLLRGEDAAPHPEGVYIQGQVPYDETWRAVRTEDAMLAIDRGLGTQFLFDTDADPYQTENLVGREEAADREADLRETLVEMLYRYDDRDFTAVETSQRSNVHSILEPSGDVFDEPE